MEQSIVRIAHKLFGISLIAWGIQQCINGQIIVGRPPAWPSSMQGEFIAACIVGAWLILNGVAVIINKRVDALIPTAIFIVVYCVLRNLWVVLTEGDVGIHLTNFGKGITLTGGLLLVTVTSLKDRVPKSTDTLFVRISVYCIGFFLFVSGIQHFIYSEFVKFLVPAWIPFPIFWTYASGIALALLGLGLIAGIKRLQIAFLAGLMIFSWFLILHIPRGLQDTGNLNEWVAVFEALAFSCVLFIIGKSAVVSSVLRKA